MSTAIFFQLVALTQAQVSVNRIWETHSGNPMGLQWTNSITNASNELISVGNTSVAGQGANIFVTKVDKNGNIAWQADFNSVSNANDYGVALTQDISGNVYIVGSTDNNTTTDHDVLVIKYSSSGSLLWSTSYASTYGLNDIGTAIKVDSVGNVYVCASSEGSTTTYDFLTLKFDVTGSLQWSQRYDYASLVEIPIGIEIDNYFGYITVTGSSGTNATRSAYAVVRYTPSGTYVNAIRSSLPGIGQDQPLAYKKDASGNLYITGRGSSDGINYDIKTIKLDVNYNILWTEVFDFAGKEDLACAIDVDAFGNVFVGGFVTNVSNVKEMAVVKYDAGGNLEWSIHQAGVNPVNDASIKGLEVKAPKEIFFLGGETGLNGTTDCVLSKIDGDGNLIWTRKLNRPYSETPMSLNVAADTSVIITIVADSAMNQYRTIKYTEFSQDSALVTDTATGVSYKDKELIMRFLPSALNTSVIDNKYIEFGGIQDFLTPAALADFNRAIEGLCRVSGPKENPCGITAVKIFRQLKSTDTHTLSRLGETIPIPDFWATLLLVLPSGMGMDETVLAMRTIEDMVAYAEPNYIATLLSTNDPQYNVQHSLHNTGYFPDAHINVEEAWDVVPSGGVPTVRCGVFDGGIDWKHEDFGYDGSNPNSSRVVNGWDFRFNVPIKSSPNVEGAHATPVAGIIGAVRNNFKGIAGVAGGNGSLGTGISLYSLKIIGYTTFQNDLTYIANAITTSSIDNPTLNYGYGLHISSNSWRIPKNSSLATLSHIKMLNEAVHFANRAKVTYVVARGNEGQDNINYPAVFDDDWVLSVGGSGIDGNYKEFSSGIDNDWAPSYGHDMDLIAPCVTDLVRTTKENGGYINYNGTSISAPHVSGVVGLLMSYWNSPSSTYQNLAPEDCENLLQISATDVGPTGYDPKNGWGRLNAGNALKLIERPFNAVNHFGTNLQSPHFKTITPVSTGELIWLKDYIKTDLGSSLALWKPYRVNKYLVEAEVNHTLAPEEDIVAYWPRHSSSSVFEFVVDDSLMPRERILITSLNRTTCKMIGYVYEVYDTSGAFKGWIPHDTALSKVQFEYTILTHKDLPASIEEVQEQGEVKLFPNPSTHLQTLLVQGESDGLELRVDLYDMQGRFLRCIYKGNAKSISVDISDLSSSMYFYRVSWGDKNRTLRFVKQ